MKTNLPFKGLEIGDKNEIVQTRFSGKTAELTPEAVAVYDLLKGAEIIGNHKVLRKCLDWFIKNHPKEYMILLD